MSPPDTSGSEGFFENLLGDLMKLLQTKGPVHWELAHQLATGVASGGKDEPNVDPLVRMRLEELIRVADLHVTEVTGLSTSATGKAIEAQPVSRSTWAWHTLEAWRPLLEALATSLMRQSPGEIDGDAWQGLISGHGESQDSDEEGFGEPDLLGGWVAAVGPVLVSVQCGATIGHLAQRALGQYDLPVPRPLSDRILLVPANISSFADDWSLRLEDVELWVCLREVSHHAVLGLAHVRDRISNLLQSYARGFDPQLADLEGRLSGIDLSDTTSMEKILGDPAVFLEEMQTPAQRATVVQLKTVVAVLEGYIDHVVLQTGQRLITTTSSLAEAMRRRRIEGKQGERLAERLLGIQLDKQSSERGTAFIQGVLERAGEGGLALLWSSAANFPTQAEVDAPGLWLERISLPLD
ncbi:MAG: zinc-dependent metalloprotease [Actinomycetota bacterium]|nr:zinc-dependent metalloprotease [Actinomycetota bacterium]